MNIIAQPHTLEEEKREMGRQKDPQTKVQVTIVFLGVTFYPSTMKLSAAVILALAAPAAAFSPSTAFVRKSTVLNIGRYAPESFIFVLFRHQGAI